MIQIIKREDYHSEKDYILELIADLYKNDSANIADVEEIINHLDFIFAQPYNQAFLLLDITDKKLNCMVNFLEYDNIVKDWCVFSVFTRKEKRMCGLAEQILKSGINFVEQFGGRRIISGIEYDNLVSQKLHEKLNFKYEGKDWKEIDASFPDGHLAFIYTITPPCISL